MKLQFASMTHPGQVRAENEDACGVWVPDDVSELERRGALFVVADGMGGHRGGEIASSMAIDALSGVTPGESPDACAALRRAFEVANQNILERSIAESTLFGMGTTCTAMALVRGNACFAHVGDSRAYLLRNGQISQLTHDHSLVGEMVRSGIISDEDARNHPRRNVITRSLGIQESIAVDAPHSPMPLQPNDVFVLCSDGLTAHVMEEEIGPLVQGVDPNAACQALADTANSRGGRDNITVIVVRVDSA